MEKLATIVSIIPSIINAVKAIEAAIPGSSQGSAKLDAVLAIIEQAESSIAPLTETLRPIVATLVNLFNVTGVFKKTA